MMNLGVMGPDELLPDNRLHLRLLATTDVHMNLSGYSETHGYATPDYGLARLANVIAEDRANAQGLTLLFDNGDILQGTPLGTTAAKMPCTPDHPFVATVTALGYDALGLGNHDFDFGPDYLARLISALPMPVLSANVDGVPGLQRSVILDRAWTDADQRKQTLRIGVTSALPMQTAQWSAHSLDGKVTITEPLAAIAKVTSDLREAGADIVIVLAHSGLNAVESPEGSEFFAYPAARMAGVDAVVAGHTHELVPDPVGALQPFEDRPGHVGACPVVQPGFRASHLGRIDLALQLEQGEWSLCDSQSQLRPVSGQDADPTLLKGLHPARAATQARLTREIGQNSAHMHSYFSLLGQDLGMGFVAETLIAALPKLPIPADWADLPRLAAVPPGLTGGLSGPDSYVDLPPGPVPARAIDMLCPFENILTARRMTGANLRLWLERAAAIFNTPRADEAAQHLLHPDMPTSFFDTIFGLEIEIDPCRPARYAPSGALADPDANRVTSLRYQGQPVKDTDSFLVAMYSYRAAGGGGYPDVGEPLPDQTTGPDARDLLLDAFQTRPAMAPTPVDWRLKLGSGCEVLYDTSPAAEAHLNDIVRFGPQVLSITSEGFLRLKLRL